MNEDIFNGTLDIEEARDLLHKVVAAKGPSFQYRKSENDLEVTNCLYVTRDYAIRQWGFSETTTVGHPTTPCIIGAVLDLRGDTWHHAKKYSHSGVSVIHRYDEAGEASTPHFTFAAMSYLSTAQQAQDRGTSWGSALTAAEEVYARMHVNV